MVVGVNRYGDDPVAAVAAPDYAALAASQRRRLAEAKHGAIRGERRAGAGPAAGRGRRPAATLMAPILEAVRARATVGEIADVLRERGETTTQDGVPIDRQPAASFPGGPVGPGPRAWWPAGPTVPIPDNLVIEGIPAIPAGLAVDVRRYTEARAATLSWHPTREEMLISTRFANTAQLHVSACRSVPGPSSPSSTSR